MLGSAGLVLVYTNGLLVPPSFGRSLKPSFMDMSEDEEALSLFPKIEGNLKIALQMHSDAFRYIQIHSDTFICGWKCKALWPRPTAN
jgi:hypothetical protein